MSAPRHVDTLGRISGLLTARMADRELLQRFIVLGDQDAFSILVDRYGPMVMRVCRRRLADVHAAEDAFQATFLVMIRKIGSIRPESLGSWLHRVACRIAGRADRSAARPVSEQCGPTSPLAAPFGEVTLREARSMLDEELSQLPEKYRWPLVLCYLEEKTRDEAVQQLGWPEGTFKKRLEKGRELLRQRLSRRGLTLSAALLATLMSGEAVAALSHSLKQGLLASAVELAAGKPLRDVASERVARLAEVVLFRIITIKLGLALLASLLLAMTGLGIGMLLVQVSGEQTTRQAPQTAADPLPMVTGDPLPDRAVARLGSVRFRHESAYAVAISPDGKKIASAGGLELCIWDAASGKELARFQPSSKWVNAVAFSPDGQTLVAAGEDHALTLWHVGSGKKLRLFQGHEECVFSVAFSPDGRCLASASRDQTVRLWDPATGRELCRLVGHKNQVEFVTFAPKGDVVASASCDDSVRLWDPTTGKELCRFSMDAPRDVPSHVNSDKEVAFSPDGKILATRSGAHDICLWDLATRTKLRLLKGHGNCAIVFSPDGRTIASSSYGVRLWDVASGKELRRCAGPDRSVFSLAFAPDGRTLAAASLNDAAVLLWDTATGKELYVQKMRPITSVAFSPQGNSLVCTWDSGWCLWEPKTNRQQFPPVERQGDIVSAVFSPDGSTIALAGEKLSLWDVAQCRELSGFQSNEPGWVWSIAFSADGKTIASGGTGGAIGLWDAQSRARKCQYPAHLGSVRCLAFAPDGRTLLSASEDRTLRLWSLTSGKQLWISEEQESQVHWAAFSPSGRLVASRASGGAAIRLWETVTGKAIGQIDGHGVLAFSPDGRLLACGGSDPRTIQLWDIVAGTQRAQFTGHAGTLTSLSFSPDGKQLASGSADCTVLIWNIPAPENCSAITRAPTADEMERLWTELASDDAARAWKSTRSLISAPGAALPFLQTRLKAVSPPAEAVQLPRCVIDLDSDEFAAREHAAAKLEQLGDLAVPALRKVLESEPSLELRQRAQRLLSKLEDRSVSSEELRSWRALEVLEQIGTAQARQLLQKLAGGAAGHRVTEEAKATLHRLTKSSASR